VWGGTSHSRPSCICLMQKKCNYYLSEREKGVRCCGNFIWQVRVFDKRMSQTEEEDERQVVLSRGIKESLGLFTNVWIIKKHLIYIILITLLIIAWKVYGCVDCHTTMKCLRGTLSYILFYVQVLTQWVRELRLISILCIMCLCSVYYVCMIIHKYDRSHMNNYTDH